MKHLIALVLAGAAAVPGWAQTAATDAPPPPAELDRLNQQLQDMQRTLEATRRELQAMKEARVAGPSSLRPTTPMAPTPPTPPTPPVPPVPPTPPTEAGGAVVMRQDGGRRVHYSDVMLTNRDFVVGADEVVDGNARLVRGDLQVEGVVNGDASTTLGDLYINGHVAGNAVTVKGDLELGPKAVVDGDVQVHGGDLRREEGARVGGSIRMQDGPPQGSHTNGRGGVNMEEAMLESAFPLPFAIVLALFGIVMLSVCPKRVDTVGRAFVNRPVQSFLVGLCSFPAMAVLFILSAITIVGPVAAAFSMIGALLMGVVAMALMFGRRVAIGRDYRSRFYPLIVGLLVWFLVSAFAHMSQPLLVVTTLATGVGYIVAIGATFSTGFGKSPFWLRDRLSRQPAGALGVDPRQSYAGTADAYGDIV